VAVYQKSRDGDPRYVDHLVGDDGFLTSSGFAIVSLGLPNNGVDLNLSISMLDRKIENELKTTAGEYPVVVIIGPRQSGKTTLARKFFRHHTYVNLEHPELRSLAQDDPKTFMLRYPAPVIFDEIQNAPELLSWIQVIVDEKPELTGGYILTGSHQLQLREAITQSLAGRTALLTLFPFALNELEKSYTQQTRETLIHNGFMPRLHDKHIRPGRLYRDYFQTYVERDVRKLMPIEIKSSRIYRSDFLKGIRYFQKISGTNQPGMLIYDGDLEMDNEVALTRNFRNVWK